VLPTRNNGADDGKGDIRGDSGNLAIITTKRFACTLDEKKKEV